MSDEVAVAVSRFGHWRLRSKRDTGRIVVEGATVVNMIIENMIELSSVSQVDGLVSGEADLIVLHQVQLTRIGWTVANQVDRVTSYGAKVVPHDAAILGAFQYHGRLTDSSTGLGIGKAKAGYCDMLGP